MDSFVWLRIEFSPRVHPPRPLDCQWSTGSGCHGGAKIEDNRRVKLAIDFIITKCTLLIEHTVAYKCSATDTL